MPKNHIIVYIWKKPTPVPTRSSFMSWAGSLSFKPSKETELSSRDSHIALSIATENDNKYFSFWPKPFMRTTEPGALMHTQREDIQSMGREADLILIASNADTDRAINEARYFAALWVNHLHFNQLPWGEQQHGHKTAVKQNPMQDDHSTNYIYNILLSSMNKDKRDFYPAQDTAGNITIDSLSAALIRHPEVTSDLSAFAEILSQKTVVFPEYPLYLKLKNNTSSSEENRANQSTLQYRETKPLHGYLFIYCKMLDGKTSGYPMDNIVTDHDRMKMK